MSEKSYALDKAGCLQEAVSKEEFNTLKAQVDSMVATDAKNVTEKINGKLITNIFETDGTTVKKATSADTAETITGTIKGSQVVGTIDASQISGKIDEANTATSAGYAERAGSCDLAANAETAGTAMNSNKLAGYTLEEIVHMAVEAAKNS